MLWVVERCRHGKLYLGFFHSCGATIPLWELMDVQFSCRSRAFNGDGITFSLGFAVRFEPVVAFLLRKPSNRRDIYIYIYILFTRMKPL